MLPCFHASDIAFFLWVRIVKAFTVERTWIAQEDTTKTSDIKHNYLCEPLRDINETPVKFSGSNTAGNNTSLQGATADAFAHFSLVASKGNLVFTDLQGV